MSKEEKPEQDYDVLTIDGRKLSWQEWAEENVLRRKMLEQEVENVIELLSQKSASTGEARVRLRTSIENSRLHRYR